MALGKRKRGRPLDTEKHHGILNAARDLLLSHKPFTIEGIAQAAKVSRTTVYKHFGDLDALKTVALLDYHVELVESLEAPQTYPTSLRQGLIDLGLTVAASFTNTKFRDFVRILISKRSRKPSPVILIFYDKYALAMRSRVDDLLEWGIENGEIRMSYDQKRIVVDQLLSMWQGFQTVGLLLDALELPDESVQKERIIAAVDLILGAYKPTACED